MTSVGLQQLLDEYSYEDILLYLKEKYGLPSGPYFVNENCRSTNAKITRSNEGLFIHHDKEGNRDDFSCHNLSDPVLAKEHSFDFQQPYNLTYCNLLEHFLLHLKIHELRYTIFGVDELDGCEKFLIPQLNDMYITKKYKNPRFVAIKEAIKEDYEAYLYILEKYGQMFDRDVDELKKLTLRTRH